MAMNDKFKVYAQTRATRQLAGDVARSIKVTGANKKLLLARNGLREKHGE